MLCTPKRRRGIVRFSRRPCYSTMLTCSTASTAEQEISNGKKVHIIEKTYLVLHIQFVVANLYHDSKTKSVTNQYSTSSEELHHPPHLRLYSTIMILLTFSLCFKKEIVVFVHYKIHTHIHTQKRKKRNMPFSQTQKPCIFPATRLRIVVLCFTLSPYLTVGDLAGHVGFQARPAVDMPACGQPKTRPGGAIFQANLSVG